MSPLPHSAGFLLQAGMLKGAQVFLESRFDTELVLQRIAADRVTLTFMVPTMIYRVLDSAAGREAFFFAVAGAAPDGTPPTAGTTLIAGPVSDSHMRSRL